MPMFVDPSARVPVTLGENTVYIRAKMDAGTKAQVSDEVRARGVDGETDSREVRGLGSYRMLLMIHNIVDWEGPDFCDEKGVKVPCTRANIRRLDPTGPMFDAVGERIGELNADPETPEGTDPN